MSTREKLIKARLGLLALAEELQNVRLACKRAGISRSHFYEIRNAYEKYGAEGLAPKQRRKPRMPNQTPPELEKQILEMTTRYPTYSYVRISGQLRLGGVGVSASMVRGVWQRHGLTLRIQRLLWLERKTAAESGVLTESQIRLLRKHRARTVDPEKHVEAPHPGYPHLPGTPTTSAPSRAWARSTCTAWWTPTARWALPSSTCRRSRSPPSMSCMTGCFPSMKNTTSMSTAS